MRSLTIALLSVWGFAPSAMAQKTCDCAYMTESSAFTGTGDSKVTFGAKPEYPHDSHKEAECKISFLLDAAGVPFDIHPNCSEPEFNRSAERFAARMKYDLEDDSGHACFEQGVRQVYPIKY